jgi:Peptidase inhibitor family I36
MHAVLASRKVFLSAFVALALLAFAMFVATPKASAEISQCSGETWVCAWSGENYEPREGFSHWPANSGCYEHPGNPRLRSVWNRTDHWIRVGGQGEVPPHERISFNPGWPAITGIICT